MLHSSFEAQAKIQKDEYSYASIIEQMNRAMKMFIPGMLEAALLVYSGTATFPG